MWPFQKVTAFVSTNAGDAKILAIHVLADTDDDARVVDELLVFADVPGKSKRTSSHQGYSWNESLFKKEAAFEVSAIVGQSCCEKQISFSFFFFFEVRFLPPKDFIKFVPLKVVCC